MRKNQRQSNPARQKRGENGHDATSAAAHLDRLLDDALAASFPASDPVSTLAHDETQPAPSSPEAPARDPHE
jgi:hypothetical protein